MKKYLLFVITIIGLGSVSLAAANNSTAYVCNGYNEDNSWQSAMLVTGTQWGTIADLTDNYDSTQRLSPSPNSGYLMKCKNVGSTIECRGRWNVVKENAKVVFFKDAKGDMFATFKRSRFYGGDTVTKQCFEQVK